MEDDLEESKFEMKREERVVVPFKGPQQVVELAPETDLHMSKRYDGLASQARDMIRKEDYLREQALEKERIFKRNVSNLKIRIFEFQKKIDEEVDDRQVNLDKLKARFSSILSQATQEVEDELEACVAVAQNDWLPQPEQRLDNWAADFDHFVKVTVPETIENQSGRVTRHLIKAQETFDIDNAKLMKRERNIIERFETHKRNASANMKEVTRKRKSCFLLFEEDMYREEKDSDTAEERHMHETYQRVSETHQLQSGLAGIRAQTDSDILVAIEESMSRLQQSVLENFGVNTVF